ncbi:helix-turn-helix domain-containing protein [Ralstonia sp. 3PA37C10]|uniref:helix-turn-helix domain-containing protein n=1 Tax=Ralstonia TaxID=48736 RepID=UPI0020180839|nr:helix-turn-helix domain-containing protein [Ralstonia sp. 3PA37C10]
MCNTPSIPNPAPLLDRQEAAAYLGLKPQTLANWAVTKAHNLPYVKVGRNVRYRKQDLDAFIQRNLHGTSFDVIAAESANV